MSRGQALEVEFSPPQRRRIEQVATHRQAEVDGVRPSGPGVLVAVLRKR